MIKVMWDEQNDEKERLKGNFLRSGSVEEKTSCPGTLNI